MVWDFNSHTSWRYPALDLKGEEVEDLNQMTLIYPTSEHDVAKIAWWQVEQQLEGSDHNPITFHSEHDCSPEYLKTMPKLEQQKEWNQTSQDSTKKTHETARWQALGSNCRPILENRACMDRQNNAQPVKRGKRRRRKKDDCFILWSISIEIYLSKVASTQNTYRSEVIHTTGLSCKPEDICHKNVIK